MSETLADMNNQWNKQLHITPIDTNANYFLIKYKNVSVTEIGIRTRNNIYNFSGGFSMFVTN